jgi:hypothetical protein
MRKSIIPIIIIIFFYGCFSNIHDGNVEVGRVLSKTVIGKINSQESPVILNQNGSISVVDTSLNWLINNNDSNLIIDENIENEILKKYQEIKYVANIRLCIHEKNIKYTLNRNNFNNLAVNLTIKFQLNEDDRSKIEKLLEH